MRDMCATYTTRGGYSITYVEGTGNERAQGEWDVRGVGGVLWA